MASRKKPSIINFTQTIPANKVKIKFSDSQEFDLGTIMEKGEVKVTVKNGKFSDIVISSAEKSFNLYI